MDKDIAAAIMFFCVPAIYLVSCVGKIAGVLFGVCCLTGGFLVLNFFHAGIYDLSVLGVLFLVVIAHAFRINSKGDLSSSLSRLKSEEGRLKMSEEKLKESKENFAKLVKSEKESLLMYSVIKLLSEAVDLEPVKRSFAEYIKKIFLSDNFVFFIADYNEKMIPFTKGKRGLSLWSEISSVVRASGKDISKPFYSEGEKIFFVPVAYAENLCGAFALSLADSDIAAEDILTKMEEFSKQLAFAIRRLQLFTQVELLSRVDGLTGTYRRNVLDEKIEEEIKRSKSFRTTFGYMIADIDRFKNINDKYGHQFGDFVLNKIGALLKSSVYETDFVGRYGGEEFAVVLPRADFEGVLRKAEFIRAKVENEVFEMGFESVRITLSVGIAHFPRDGNSASEIIKKADEALYYAKENGRNRVIDAASL